MILTPTAENIALCASQLRNGELVSFPTETVYGLGTSALDTKAVEKIFTAKGRPSNNPLIVHVSSIDLIESVALIESENLRTSLNRISKLWPGPLTVVLPKKRNVPDIVSASLPTVGVRIPSHPIAKQLLEAAGIPIAGPSANKSNYVSATTALHVHESFPEIPILDGGACSVGIESTILSLIDPETPTLLRYGAISKEKIAEALGVPSDAIQDVPDGPVLAAGMMKKHYAPKTPIKFLSEIDLWELPPMRIGFISFSEHQHLDFDFHAVYTLSANGDLNDIAQRLFAALREQDSLELDLIVVDSCLETGIGKAIMDRLRRAAAKDV